MRSGAAAMAALLLAAADAPLAGASPEVDLAPTARRFVDLFLEGRFEELPEMTPDMRGAFPPVTAQGILDEMVAFHGPVQTVGDPWFEDTVQEYLRYRIPVTFKNQTLDLRVVFDRQGRVAGFFMVPHLPPLPAEGPPRPQEPKAPYGYDEREVVYPSGEITLAGTLTLPPGKGPSPAVLLISGSGLQNRDEEILGHKPFLVLSDHLTRAGIAVLRADDRGVGGSTGDLSRSTTQDLAGDALAGVGFLRDQPEIDGDRVGILGHSEGASVGAMAASRSKDVAFLILLAGSGVRGDELMVHQLRVISREAGIDDARLEEITAEQRKLLELIRSEASDDSIRTQLERLVRAQTEYPESKALPRDMLEAQVGEMTSPWFRSFLDVDPRSALRRVRAPVLAVGGELDLQVDPQQNLPEIREALEQAGNPDVTTRAFPGLNHLFQTAETGSPEEYSRIEETMAPVVLETVSEWILTRFGEAAPR